MKAIRFSSAGPKGQELREEKEDFFGIEYGT